MKLKSLTLLLLLLVAILLPSCLGKMVVGKSEQYATLERGAIPPDIGKDSSTLLIVMMNNKNVNRKKVEKVASENYHGSFEVVKKKEFENEKYQDSVKYRYVLLVGITQGATKMTTTSHTTGTGASYSTTDYSQTVTYQYSVLDRKENKTYKCPMTSTFYKDVVHGYLVNLEKQREGNAGK